MEKILLGNWTSGFMAERLLRIISGADEKLAWNCCSPIRHAGAARG